MKVVFTWMIVGAGLRAVFLRTKPLLRLRAVFEDERIGE